MLLMFMLLSLQVIENDKLESEVETVRSESFPHVCPTPDEACEVPVEYLTPSPQIKVTIDNFDFPLKKKMQLMRFHVGASPH